jgi:hypothetical protein
MEAGFIRFDPASEFEVIESFDFEEEIARPESLRFFTLDEQLKDYFEKVLPKKGKITKFEYNTIAQEVDRLREIYERLITVTDTDYMVDLSRKEIHVDWVKPIYTDLELVPYSYASNWIPLYKPGLRTTPNYYPRMLGALPKPYRTTGMQGVSHTSGGVMVDDDGKHAIQTLGTYKRTKGVLHEDGSFTVVKLPITNTADDIKVKGFFIEPRSIEIPNPLPNNPFLASNTSSKFITDEPLDRVFPTIESIMTHGVPNTPFPYSEGKKFLKIYDVSLSQIPWNLWKERFPPADTISATPTIMSVTFDRPSDEAAPSKGLQEIYVNSWYPGVEPRFWLSKQEDNGSLVSKMLLSSAGKNGLVTPALMTDKPATVLTPSTPEECFVMDSFDAFLNSGVYRSPPWKDVDSAVDKHKPIPMGHCIPVAQIVQERADALVAGKLPWKETTDTEILKEHQQLLKFFQYVETKQKVPVYDKYAGQQQSDLRRQILAVLRDTDRTPVDKAEAIEKLVRGTTHKDEQYFDKDDSFLVCGHTLSELRGDLENDIRAFYDKWTAIDEGFRSCKFCGQQINADVFVAQDDFDEEGNAIKSHDVLGDSSSHGGESHIAAFSTSLSKLKTAFMLENPGESILYLLLSLLQVLPTESQLLPVVQNIRELTSVLRANKKIEKAAKERTEGILGIAGMVVLLQTHNPFLIPRRSFGSKILKLTGYPRDTDDVSDSPTLDIVISILKTTFESSPNTFKGPTTTLLRLVISKPKDVRKESILFIKQAAQKFKTQFMAAKERYEVPIDTVATGQISLPVVRIEKASYSPSERIGQDEQKSSCDIPMPRTYITGRLPPNVVQDPIILAPTKPSELARYIVGVQESPKVIVFTDAEVRRRAALGFPKSTKLDKIEAFLRSDTDGIAFLALLNRILDVLSRESYPIDRLIEYRSMSVFLQTTMDKSLVRDASRGIVYELMHEIMKDRNKSGLLNALSTALQRDLVFSMILITKEQATKQESDLRTREREVFKQRMRSMNDTEREATKMLLDIGIAPYIITNEDREIFAREYNLPDPESEYERIAQEQDMDRPEEGYNVSRDVEDDQAAIVNGHEQQVDYGDYGDRREDLRDRNYEAVADFDFDEGYGV